MCKAMEDMIAEARAEGRAEGLKESAMQIAKNILALHKSSYDEIATLTGLTVDEIKELDTKKPS